MPNPFQGLPNVTGTSGYQHDHVDEPVAQTGHDSGRHHVEQQPWGKNQFDAMLVKVEHRFSKGFSVINSFTWSKLFEDTSWTGPEIAGRRVEHKLGGEDRPMRLSVAPIWSIPVGRKQKFGASMPKALDAVVGGWMLSGQFQIQSGVPVVFGTDSFFSGQNFALQSGAKPGQVVRHGAVHPLPGAQYGHLDVSGVDRHPEPSGVQLEADVGHGCDAGTACTRTSRPTSATIRRAGATFAPAV